MASDALLSEWASSFLDRLTPENRALWDNELQDQFIASPINETTVDYAEAGEPDAKATLMGPFLVIWRFVNVEVIAVATIRWGPGSEASDPNLRRRM